MLKQWEKATNELVQAFIAKHYDKDAEWYWVSGEIGGTLFVNDNFYNLDDIVQFERYKYSTKEMFEYKEYTMDFYAQKMSNKEYPINIKTWKYANKRNKKT